MCRIELYLTLGLSLAATLLTELGVALLFKKRGTALLVVAAVNLLTNPIVVLVWKLTAKEPWIFFGMELAAVMIEGCCYRLFSEKFRRPFLFSLLCNLISCTIGIMMNGGIL